MATESEWSCPICCDDQDDIACRGLRGWCPGLSLDEEVLVQKLQNCLSQHTRTFVPRLITAAVRLCGWAVRQHLGQQDPRAAGGEDNGPAASPSSTASPGWTPAPHPASSSSAAGPDVEEEASTSEATLRGGPDSRPSAPVPAEQDQPQEEPGEAAAAGPSAQGCSPSAPGRGRDRLPRGPWRPPKRKASGPRDSAQPARGHPAGGTSRALSTLDSRKRK
ncbi:translation initiation factor IF-2-like [Aquila chrysaetos chrysaetos]|uniref:translation initiation factor IF-2-like n=1 Tax=Aquila chrysaetos chrysaetos TaxID=223781 RepID=UPI001B7D3E9F|nr:translation initiation factor IF-2-like [Aquila chrysaetos chrysaetos]